jgi:hypothetical protein
VDPTETRWDIEQDENGFVKSTCRNSPPNVFVNSLVSSMIEFDYFLYLPDVEMEQAEEAASSVKFDLHMSLTREPLTCDYGSDLSIVELSSQDADTVFGRCPDLIPDSGESCWLVNAKMTAILYSRLSTTEVADQFVHWLTSILPSLVDGVTILEIQFQGFTNLDLDGKETGEAQPTSTQPGPAALNTGNIPITEETTSFGGLVVLGVAAAILGVLLGLVIVRRKNRREAYLRRVNEVKDLDLDQEEKAEMEQKSGLVNDNDLYAIDEAFQSVELEDAGHDYRTCASRNCELCQKRTQPILFVATDFQAEVIADLAPTKYQPGSNATQVNNTQVL